MKVALCAVDAIPVDGSTTVEWFGREVVIYRVDGAPHAIVNICPHLGGPLEAEGEEWVCPWHGARFTRRDGRRVRGPAHAEARLMRLPTRIEDGTLFYVWGE